MVREASHLNISADPLQSGKIRLSWLGVNNSLYEILERSSAEEEWRVLQTVQGTFPLTEFVVNSSSQIGSTFFCVRKP